MGAEVAMTDDLRWVQLDVRAIAYLKQQLAKGKGLARALLRHQRLETGLVQTFLPSWAKEEAAHAYEKGCLHEGLELPLKTPSPPTGARANLATYLQAELAKAPERLCLFEDALASSRDRWLTKALAAETHNLLCGQDVYYFLDGTDPQGTIERTIRRAHSIAPPGIGVLASLPQPLAAALKAHRQLTEADLAQVAQRAEQIIVDAYDGEGYLIWR